MLGGCRVFWVVARVARRLLGLWWLLGCLGGCYGVARVFGWLLGVARWLLGCSGWLLGGC